MIFYLYMQRIANVANGIAQTITTQFKRMEPDPPCKLYLKKTGESEDQVLIDNMRRSCHGKSCDEDRDKKFLVYFDIEKDLPLIVKKD